MVADWARGGLRWTFDLAGAQQMYSSYKELEYWDDMAAIPRGVTVNVVHADKSDRCYSPLAPCPTTTTTTRTRPQA